MEKKDKVLYLIQHKKIPEYTKIGYTTDLQKRIKSLQTSSPTGIHVLYSKETSYAYKIEQMLHKRYAHKNTNLEWFNLSSADIIEIIQWIEIQINRNK